jgi:hypothetical protein
MQWSRAAESPKTCAIGVAHSHPVHCMGFVLPCKPGAVVNGSDENVSAIELAVMAP